MRLEDLTAFFIIKKVLSCSKLNYYEIPPIVIATKRQSTYVRLKLKCDRIKYDIYTC